MKYKLVITESQYHNLLDDINEQGYINGGKKRKNWKHLKLKPEMRRAPGWLTKIIGNKVDGYTINLPNSNDETGLNAILNGDDISIYLTKEYIDRLKKLRITNSYLFNTIQKTNPKFLATIIKLLVVNQFVFTSLTLTKGRVKSTTPPPDKKPVGEPLITGDTESFPLDGTGKQYFENNEWVINQTFKDEFKSQILDKLKNKVDQGVVQDLNVLNIDSSCSRLRNGVPRKSPGHEKWSKKNRRITFAELSEQRNNAAKNYILQELAKIGINTSKVKITQNTLGDNKDGTSGPDYTGGDAIPYNQYKFLKVEMKFGQSINGGIDVRPKPEPIDGGLTSSSYVYGATLTSPNVPYRLPGLYWTDVWDPKIEQTTERCKVNSKGETECGVEPGKFTPPKDWSTDPSDPAYRGPSKLK